MSRFVTCLSLHFPLSSNSRSAWQFRDLSGGHQEEHRVAEETQQRRWQRWWDVSSCLTIDEKNWIQTSFSCVCFLCKDTQTFPRWALNGFVEHYEPELEAVLSLLNSCRSQVWGDRQRRGKIEASFVRLDLHFQREWDTNIDAPLQISWIWITVNELS